MKKGTEYFHVSKPTITRWLDGTVPIKPSGREFSPKELESFVFWRDEHRQLVEKFGHIDQPKAYPAKENVLPFRGGHRMKAAKWIPSKSK
ncbi:TPA: phage protein [Vibrio campbellii]|nr:phage protein [Vibrio campbellii]HDM8242033.1 phage protein [Vibrio campbellii]